VKNLVRIVYGLLGVILNFIIPCSISAQSAQRSNLIFTVNETGNVSVTIKLSFASTQSGSSQPQQKPQLGDQLQLQNSIWAIALPFGYELGKRINSANDVHLAPLSSGKGFVLLSLSKPATLSQTTIEISEMPLLTETPDGKAKFEFDLSYPNMSQSDRELLNSAFAIKEFDVNIVLPKKYDEADVNQRPQFSKKDDTTYFLLFDQAKQGQSQPVWISFPNPIQRRFEIAKLLVTFLVGLFTLAIQYPLLKGKNTWWFVGVFILASVTLGFIAYYGFGLAKRLEFLISVAVIIPNAIYALIASVYLILAKKYQATITGQIRINNASGKYASVKLLHVQNGNSGPVKKTDELREDGRYYFYMWGKKKAEKYQVIATYNSIDCRSAVFQVSRGAKIDVPPIDFEIAVKENPTV